MINLSNVLSLPVRQAYGVKKQKENNNLTDCSKNNVCPKLVSPSLEHLKANYLTFKGNSEPVEETQLEFPFIATDSKSKEEAKTELPSFLSNMLSEEQISGQLRFKPYEKTADLIAQNCFKGDNTMVVHEGGAMQDLVANNFAAMLDQGKFKNLDMTKENTNVYYFDTAQMRSECQSEEEVPKKLGEALDSLFKKADKADKETLIFISDPTIIYPKIDHPKIKTVAFVPLEHNQHSPTSLSDLMNGGAPSSNGGKHGQIPKEIEKILNMNPSINVLELPSPGAPETKSFLKANKDRLITPGLPDGVIPSNKAIDESVDKTKEFEGAYPGKALDFLFDAIPAALMKKTLKKDSKYTVITANSLRKGVSAYPEVVNGIKITEGKSYSLILDTKTKLKDVGGIDHIEDLIRDSLINKIGPRKTKNSQDVPPSSVLIAGDAGSGKTLLVKAMAGEAKVPLIHVSTLKLFDSLYSTHMKGSSDTSEIKDVFDYAKAAARDSNNKTAFLYLDDLDAMTNKSNKLQDPILEEKNSKDIYLEEILKQVKKIDNKNSDVNIVVLASSQFPELLQSEFSKTGLFNTQIQAPDNARSMDARISTITLFTKDLEFENEESKRKIIKESAKVTEGASGAELKAIIGRAGSIADRRKENKNLTINDVLESLLELTAGHKIKSELPEWDNKATIKHELGHAVVGQTLFNMPTDKWLKPNEIDFITFDQRSSGFLAAVYFGKGEGGANTFDALIAEMALSYGSIYTEKMMFNGRSTYGPSADIEGAMQTAKVGINCFGLGPSTGFITDPEMMQKENKEDVTVMVKTASKVAEMIIDFHKDFINEYGDECFSKLGKGGNTMSAEVFKGRLNDWLDKEDRRQKLKLMEAKIQVLTDEARTKGKLIKNDKQLTDLAKAKLKKEADTSSKKV